MSLTLRLPSRKNKVRIVSCCTYWQLNVRGVHLFMLRSYHSKIKHSNTGTKSFFLRRIVVPPPRFRPPQRINGESFEHAQSVVLSKAITTSQTLKNLYAEEEEEEEEDTKTSSGLNKQTRILRTIVQLQETINGFMDSTRANNANGGEVPNGVRQLLEKKQGLFRMNMMGKRVNYAARSVISPDPNLATHEIGVPLRFAKELRTLNP